MLSKNLTEIGKEGNPAYECWLNYRPVEAPIAEAYKALCRFVHVSGSSPVLNSAASELALGLESILGILPEKGQGYDGITLTTAEKTDLLTPSEKDQILPEGFMIRHHPQGFVIAGKDDRGILYGVFAFLRLLQLKTAPEAMNRVENPANMLRMVNHWDNIDGSVERGYAGKSIYFRNNQFIMDVKRLRDYARLLASVGINAVVINNVNVHYHETLLIDRYLPDVVKVAEIFRLYGVTLYLSINYSSPIQLGGLDNADPLDPTVQAWWCEKARQIYQQIPDLGGFLVKADSENRPGPFTYGRNHADGANMLAKALEPFGGIVIWRCFVYNCRQDWRDRVTDRANAAYDNFMPLDGKFMDNVVLQIKNGPMDFQVREPVSPLFGGLRHTNQVLELQITQEYTGQQKHVCYLIPMWKEVLDFDTHADGSGSTVKKIVGGKLFPQKYCGVAAVSNIGDDMNWTGHILAQANLYGYGRLIWDTSIDSTALAEEWIRLTFGESQKVKQIITEILMNSWPAYENYTSPLGIGWMVNPNHHYGPSVDGYEYSAWGTYHRADRFGIGVDRTVQNGTGNAGRYYPENAQRYNSMENCPEELLLFFHHVSYDYRLKSGKTLIQHIYDTHFEGARQAEQFKAQWLELKGLIDEERFEHVLARLEIQVKDAAEWRDVVNSYFFRKTGIPDEKGRKIF
ncbi:MAG: alpha-glucuronidase [Ruminiclostridium sp.]|nr:alpha-glucuronidase [Ruminiclostridium sp.]